MDIEEHDIPRCLNQGGVRDGMTHDCVVIRVCVSSVCNYRREETVLSRGWGLIVDTEFNKGADVSKLVQCSDGLYPFTGRVRKKGVQK